jgi:Phage minor structural protein GP20
MTTPPAPPADDNDNGPDVDPVVDDSGTGDPTNADPTPTPTSTPPDPSKTQGEPSLDLPDSNAGLKKALDAERKLRKDKERELAALAKKHASAEELALMQAREAASAETEGRIRPQFLKHIASAKLEAAGASGDTVRLVGLLDLDKVQLTDDGDLAGLDDQVVALKEEFPNLFASPGGVKPPVPKANSGSGGSQGRKQDSSTTGGKPKTFADKLAAQVLGTT